MRSRRIVCLVLLAVCLSVAGQTPDKTTTSPANNPKQSGDSNSGIFGVLKDILVVGIAALALGVNAYSAQQKRVESRLSVRKQLAEVLSQLSNVNLELARQRSLPPDERLADAPGILNDQRRYLVRQASYLSDQAGPQLSAPEYLMIAWAFNAIDDVDEAERFFKEAEKSTADRFTHALAIRSYGRFLHWEGRHDRAKAKLDECIAAFGTESARARHYRGETYERWALQELDWGHQTEFNEFLDKAFAEYSETSNPILKSRGLHRIADIRSGQATTVPSTPLPPAALGAAGTAEAEAMRIKPLGVEQPTGGGA